MNLTTSRAREYERLGNYHWEDELRQIAREYELMRELGIEPPTAGSGARATTRPASPAFSTEDDDEEPEPEE